MITSACSIVLSAISPNRKANKVCIHCLPAARFRKRSSPISAAERTACASIAMPQSNGSMYRLLWITLSLLPKEERVPLTIWRWLVSIATGENRL